MAAEGSRADLPENDQGAFPTFWAFTALLNVQLGFLQIIILTMNNASHYHSVMKRVLAPTPDLYHAEEGSRTLTMAQNSNLVRQWHGFIVLGVTWKESKRGQKVFV